MGGRVNLGYILAYKHWSNDDVVRSRRYEMHREAIDDYRYIYKLRQVAAQVGGQAVADAESLINQAINNILSNVSDHTLCDKWRIEIAERILLLKGLTEPYQPMFHCGDPGTRFLQEDLNKDCYIDFADVIEIATNWLLCNDPENYNCN